MSEMVERLPKFTAALAAIDGHISDHVWKTIDQELTKKLLRAAAGGARPLGTNRYQSVAAKLGLPKSTRR